jgi:mycothiol system anti-sigma-R factor
VSCGKPHDTDCSEVIEAVFLYLDNECDESHRRIVRQHLDECSPCLRIFGIEQDVKDLVARKCGGDVAPDSLRTRLRLRLQEAVRDTTVAGGAVETVEVVETVEAVELADLEAPPERP